VLFQLLAEDAIKETLRELGEDERNVFSQRITRAVDFLEGRQIEHTRSELSRRYESAQTVMPTQPIEPITIALTERYIAEAANAYNHPVERTLVDPETGEESDATRRETDGLHRMLEGTAYDEVLHRNDQYRHAFRPAPSLIWYQIKRGALRPVVQFPHNVYPVIPDSPAFTDAADPRDYAGFVVELFHGAESDEGQVRTFAFITAAQVVFYEGSPNQMERQLSSFANTLEWDQVIDEPVIDADGDVTSFNTTEQRVGLQPLTFWHHSLPTGTLLPNTDTDIVHANLELNIAFSALFDTISYQGHATPVFGLNNPNSPKARRRLGVRFPQVLDVNETFNMVSAATSYSEQVQVLKDFVKLIAISKRMSANDFSLEGAPALSGFAKIVDSLPKLEARSENIKRLTYLEEEIAAPRLIATGIRLGFMSEAARSMRLRARFADVEFPKTEEEKTKELDRKLKHNLTSIAKEVARRDGISITDAEKVIEENREQNAAAPSNEPPEQSRPQGLGSFGLGGRIGGPGRR